METFVDKLQLAMQMKKSVLCVGLDPQLKFMPPHLIAEMRAVYGDTEEAIGELYYAFNRAIIDAVEPSAGVVKPQAAFYTRSAHTWHALEKTQAYAKYKGLLRIKDAKCKDGGDTAQAYAEAHIGEVPFFDGDRAVAPIRGDAVTIDGYIGENCVGYFAQEVRLHGTCAFVVDKTSFEPNSAIEQLVTDNGLTVWERLAHYVSVWGEGTEGKNGYRNVGVVMGATFPEDAPKMRKILPKALMLVPGYGAQGGGAEGAVVPFNEDGFGAVVNSSRGIIAAWQKGPFACDPKDFAQAAALAASAARHDLNVALMKANKFPF
ncbi:MAG: orotidine-5'-phosphate decarboxylase [Candidatus Moranbacteria bacterium]|nr:orotidine-5'-phosphate decarboxylase [Candidatus Moranbacteria bacterium]